MSSLTEQFSAATKSQLEAQFKLFNTFASTAVDSAEKVIALNLSTTKASVEKSSAAARKLLDAKDPKELFSLNAGQPPAFDLLAYGRQLVGIATAAQTELLHSAQSGFKQAQEFAKSQPLSSLAALPASPFAAFKPTPPVAASEPAATAPLVAAPAPSAATAAAELAPAPAPAATASEPAPPAALAAAVAAAVATPDNAPVIAQAASVSANEPLAAPPQKTAKAPAKPKPAAAPIAPTPPAGIKATVKPADVKSSFPVPPAKPIAVAPDVKSAKPKDVATKAKPAPGKPLDIVSNSGKGKK